MAVSVVFAPFCYNLIGRLMVLSLHIIGSNRTITLSLLKNPIYSRSHRLEIFSLNVLPLLSVHYKSISVSMQTMQTVRLGSS